MDKSAISHQSNSQKSMEHLPKLKTDYFFGDQFNLLLPANKKNVYKVYRSKKDKIDKYLEENSVDFKNPDDLKGLLTYIARCAS